MDSNHIDAQFDTVWIEFNNAEGLQTTSITTPSGLGPPVPRFIPDDEFVFRLTLEERQEMLDTVKKGLNST